MLFELDTAIEINPYNGAWHFNKALTLDSINRFEDAIEEYETALQLNADDTEILNCLAIDYTRIGQYDRAIETFETIERIDPTFEPAYCNRIITYTEMEKHDLAEQMFYLAQQINPDCALCYYNIGNSLFIRGQYEKAIQCWQRTAILEPTHPQISYRIAQSYWALSNSKQAHKHFLAELRTNPADTDAILDFGLFLLETGNIESAKEKFNRILELAPDSAVALFYLGEITFNATDYKKAVELFNKAIQLDGSLAGPRYRLACYALICGQRQLAEQYLTEEIRLSQDNPDVLVAIGSMFLVLDDIERATNCLLRAVDIEPANPQGYYYLGVASTMNHRFDDAAQFFSHTLHVSPLHMPAMKELAMVYLAMGRTAFAAEVIKSARQIDGRDKQLKRLERRILLKQSIERLSFLPGLFKPLINLLARTSRPGRF